jgi:hypothetical protein
LVKAFFSKCKRQFRSLLKVWQPRFASGK